jgi:hypothetical protein
MPGRDGTGPQGTGPRGRHRGLCRNIAPAAAGIDEEKKTEDEGNAGTGEAAGPSTTPPACGVGRGGKPRGCGMGRCGGGQG